MLLSLDADIATVDIRINSLNAAIDYTQYYPSIYSTADMRPNLRVRTSDGATASRRWSYACNRCMYILSESNHTILSK